MVVLALPVHTPTPLQRSADPLTSQQCTAIVCAMRIGRRATTVERPGMAALRLATGLLFMGHGAQKLFGVAGGRGLAGTAEEMESLGLSPGRPNAALAGAAQLGGGALLAAGLWTPWASSALNATLLVAMRTACSGRGLWAVNGGCEYPLTLVSVISLFAADGPGRLSVDAVRGREQSGAAVAALTLATAWVGSDVALRISRRTRSHAEP
jgi:putative oxidoreductase